MKQNTIRNTLSCSNKIAGILNCFDMKKYFSLINSSVYQVNGITRLIKLGVPLLLILTGSMVFNSCKLFSKKKVATQKVALFYPSEPDTARYQYLTKITHSGDLGKKTSFFRKLIIGEERGRIMSKPYGIAIFQGKIFVCDMYGGPIDVIDLVKKKMYFFTHRGRGELKTPINCFVDEKGYLYVADAGRKQVVVFNNNMEYVKFIGLKEDFKPTDVAVYDGKVFIANEAAEKINVFSNDSISKLLYSFPNADVMSPAFLGLPVNLAIGNNKIYVADFGYSKIKIYKTDGTFLDTIGSRGNGLGQFAKLKGIAVDKEENVYAVDGAFENVQIFNKAGQLLMPLGGHYDGPGGLYLPAKVIVDYDNLKYFQQYVDPQYDLKYLVIVTSQYGPDLINIYGRVEMKKKTGQ